MDPLEFSSYVKHIRECFIEVLKWGNLEKVIEFLSDEGKSLELWLINETLDGDCFCIHICAEYGHLEIMDYILFKYTLDHDLRSLKSNLSTKEILLVNWFNF